MGLICQAFGELSTKTSRNYERLPLTVINPLLIQCAAPLEVPGSGRLTAATKTLYYVNV